jgi:anti-sigma regulatory factor (Ser/Thr protein kinase)
MPCNIKTPERTFEDFGDSLRKLISSASDIASCKEKKMVIDFSSSKHLNPFYLGGLACILHSKKSSGIDFSIINDGNHGIRSYLNTIHFPETFSPAANNGDSFLSDLEKYANKTYIPIVSFETGSSNSTTTIRERVLTALFQLLKKQLGFSGEEIVPLHYFLSELTDNINEHSSAQNGFVFAQYYSDRNYLDLCICDAGQGIFQSYLNNPKFNPQTEADAMQMALSGRSTKDRAEARGFGITTTRNMLVNGLRGKLFMWSGNTTFIQTIDYEAIASVPNNLYFQGTFIAVRVPTVIPGSFKFYEFVES